MLPRAFTDSADISPFAASDPPDVIPPVTPRLDPTMQFDFVDASFPQLARPFVDRVDPHRILEATLVPPQTLKQPYTETHDPEYPAEATESRSPTNKLLATDAEAREFACPWTETELANAAGPVAWTWDPQHTPAMTSNRLPTHRSSLILNPAPMQPLPLTARPCVNDPPPHDN